MSPSNGFPSSQRDQDWLISLYIEQEPYASGTTDASLKDSGVPVWAIVGHWRAVGRIIPAVARDYDVPESAVQAALVYYDRHQNEIDARIAENAA